jgi:S-adenosylmethionine:tRNA ribosyltransferase-isomerase
VSPLEVVVPDAGNATGAGFDFTLPPGRSASRPPEAAGRARDEVRLLVASRDGIRDDRFRSLPRHLRAGDLLVINTSATMPAALDGRLADGRSVVVHVSGHHRDSDGTWVVEQRLPDGSGPVRTGSAGDVVGLPGGARLTLLAPHPEGILVADARLWRARLGGAPSMTALLQAHGRPITYGYVRGHWPLASYQSVFARVPGSAEMASAGRPFTPELVTDLVSGGIIIAPVTLHTGVSSLEIGEPPQPEPYRVPAHTARLVELTRHTGGRVVAVGTTVVRALETVVSADGTVQGGEGWTDLVLGPERPARVVTGLITGWHAPGASHLQLLQAVAGPDLVRRAYAAALAGDVLWHEFGDSSLLLP